jgi:Raf kinase inhibitor-like YbhB/YbcL family protein
MGVAGPVMAASLAGCGLVGGPALLQGDAPDIITVTSPVVVRGTIPAKYTCHGGGVSPPVHWSGAPQDTKTLALVIDDSDAPITPYIYWIVFDIGPSTTDIQQGQLPPGARQADNSAGQAVYDPPCPRNEDHSYRFTVYALHSALSLPNGTSTKVAWAAIAHAAIARGRLPVNAKS